MDTSSDSDVSDVDSVLGVKFDTDFIKPYDHEPLASDLNVPGNRNKCVEASVCSETLGEDDDVISEVNSGACNESRLNNLDWCLCKNCSVMSSETECLCCREIPHAEEKLNEGITCITDHEAFIVVCLNIDVLEVAYCEYMSTNSIDIKHLDIHRRYRYIAYRQLARWLWHRLGKKRRFVLPSCAVNKIRATFPSSSYCGFRYPEF